MILILYNSNTFPFKKPIKKINLNLIIIVEKEK